MNTADNGAALARHDRRLGYRATPNPQEAPVSTTTTLRLPAGHAMDWHSRCADGSDEVHAVIVAETARTVTLEMDDAALRDLIADAIYYAEEMDPTNTGDIDYRPKARTLLRRLERAGVTWTRRGFAVTITGKP